MFTTVKKRAFFGTMLLVLLLFFGALILRHSLEEPGNLHRVNNLILMIPDGCSVGALSFTRLYLEHRDSAFHGLAFDSLVCGMVRTHSALGPIGESSSAITAIVTGKKTLPICLGVDTAGGSLRNLVELARAQRNRNIAVGIVGTVEPGNATLAGMVAHTPNRKDYEAIYAQMVARAPEVLFAAGGEGYLNRAFIKNEMADTLRKDGLNLEDTLKSKGFDLVFRKPQFDAIDTASLIKTWGLFGTEKMQMPYEFDRPDSIPSLAEMTHKALALLRHNDGGFLLLVEGSKIDWAAHGHDPIGVLSEVVAFNEAVKVALAFAGDRANRTAVVICPDHGNGGMGIGNAATSEFKGNPMVYYKLGYREFYARLDAVMHSACATTDKMKANLLAALGSKGSRNIREKRKRVDAAIFNAYSFHPTLAETDTLIARLDSKNKVIGGVLGDMVSRNLFVGWTTTGHSGEEVFLAIAHPNDYVLKGVVDNTDVFRYMAEVMGLQEENQPPIN